MGHSPWSHKESDTTERLTLSFVCITYLLLVTTTAKPVGTLPPFCRLGD